MKQSQGFRNLLNEFPRQFPIGLQASYNALSYKAISNKRYSVMALQRYSKKASHIVICGMGGSAIAGSLMQNIVRYEPRLRKKHLHIIVHSDYGLPPEATNSKAVVLCISYSGDTEETLSAYKAAQQARLPIFAIASGGRLAVWAKRDRIPFIKIPSGLPPRFSTGYQFGALVGILVKIGLIPEVLKKETQHLERRLDPKKTLRAALKLAGRITHYRHTIVIYSSPGLSAAAYSWKTNIHENAKLPASVHIFPELDHNEINAFTPLTKTHIRALSRLVVFILEDSGDAGRMKKRVSTTTILIKKNSGVPVVAVPIKGLSLLVRLFTAQLLGLAFSGVLAERLGINPIPVPIIEELKRRLAS